MAKDAHHKQTSKIKYLNEADAAVLDAILGARSYGNESGPIPPKSAGRAQKIQSLLSMLEQDRQEPPAEDLVQRTVARSAVGAQQRRFAEQVQMLTQPQRSLGVSWGQIAAAACVLVVGWSLLMPVLERNRELKQQIACASNLGMTHAGLGNYAADHGGMLPRRKVVPGANVLQVGAPIGNDGTVHSNSANLFLIIANNYVKSDKLACPANPNLPVDLSPDAHDWPSLGQVPFSYLTPHPAFQIRIDGHPNLAFLADKNPLIIVRDDQIVFDSSKSPYSPSQAHGTPGQNILIGDGAVQWTITPTVGRWGQPEDMIYTPHNLKHLSGTERPTSPDDSLLTP